MCSDTREVRRMANINYYESEEPIYKCRWCEQEVEEEPLCAKEDTYEEKHYAESEDFS